MCRQFHVSRCCSFVFFARYYNEFNEQSAKRSLVVEHDDDHDLNKGFWAAAIKKEEERTKKIDKTYTVQQIENDGLRLCSVLLILLSKGEERIPAKVRKHRRNWKRSRAIIFR